MESSIINCTNHTVQFLNKENQKILELESNPNPARVIYTTNYDGVIMFKGYSISQTTTNEVIVNLPPPKEGVLYVVSRKVKQASDRQDLRVPSEVVRNGPILGCKHLGR